MSTCDILFQENRLAFEFEGGKRVFVCQKSENNMFYLFVSDHVVTRKCLSVRDDFFDFPIDFLRPTTITIRRSVAVRSASGRAYPPMFYSGGAKIEKWRNLIQVHETFFYGTGPQKLSSGAGENLIFTFFIISAKK